jgi:predicted nucleotidyltransferase
MAVGCRGCQRGWGAVTPEAGLSWRMVRGALTVTDIAERLADLPVERSEIALLVLFGSTVRKRARGDSDIDIAVACEGPADLDVLYAAIAARLHADPIDLVDLAHAGPVLALESLARGRCSSSAVPASSTNSSRSPLADTAIQSSCGRPNVGPSTCFWSGRDWCESA